MLRNWRSVISLLRLVSLMFRRLLSIDRFFRRGWVKFALKFDGDVDKKGAHRPVFLELDPPHTCRYSRHCDTDAVDVWLEREKFIVERKPA